MVMTLHENNINVIMDVVYNHVFDADSFGFNQIVPKYFSRTNEDGSYSNGSGCGNDTASERAMVHKYIVDSVLYWAKEYHIDGFRFDLVGLLDADTMNDVIDTVHATYPDIIFYGEGWTMNTEVGKPNVTMATQANASATPNLAYFSDTIRNLLAGNNDAKEPGFVSGLKGKEEPIANCYQAKPGWCPKPTQTVNYASCHDNYTLKDKLNLTRKDATEADRIKMNNLAAAIYMMSEGIPFIHAGEEFLRTKIAEDGEVIHNSYNSSDYVNKLRWENLDKQEYADVADYYKGLIEFRKNHKALRLTTAQEVAANVEYKWVTNEVVLFTLKGKDSVAGEVSDGIVVIFNANADAKEVDLSKYVDAQSEWKVCINDKKAGIEVLDTITDGKVTVAPISAMVLVKGETRDDNSVYLNNVAQTSEYTITFDANGGTVAVSSAVTVNNKLKELPVPTREGYTFEGWFMEPEEGKAVTTQTSLRNDRTLYARWKKIETAGGNTPGGNTPGGSTSGGNITGGNTSGGTTGGGTTGGEATTPGDGTTSSEGFIESDTAVKPGAPETTMNTSKEVLAAAPGILTDGERQAVANGVNARIWLEVALLKASAVPADDKAKIAKKAAEVVGTNPKITYLDISLWKQVGKAAEDRVSKPGVAISVTVTIPENLRNKDKTKERTYYILRAHDGVVTKIGGMYNKSTAEFTFETDRFSTYAIVYKDTDAKTTVSAATDFGSLKARAVKSTENAVTLKWSKVSGADGYLIYGNKCDTKNQKYKYELLKKISSEKNTVTIKGLEKGTFYKYKVIAYKVVNGKKVRIATSTAIHTVTAGGRYGVAKSVQISKVGSTKFGANDAVKVSIKKGRTAKISAKEVKGSKTIRHHRGLCYESSNAKVAKVSDNGKITAVGKGTCRIYVYAQNGVYKTITVTVK